MAFNRNRSFDNRSNFGGGRSFERPAMHPAVCDNCKKECEVPFRPTSGKPIFCSDCFKGKKDGSIRDRNQSQSQPQFRDQFEQLNKKLDKILVMLTPNSFMQTQITEEEPNIQSQDITQVTVEAPTKKSAKKRN